MTKFHRKSKEEIHQLSLDEFCDYMAEWDKATDEKWHERIVIRHLDLGDGRYIENNRVIDYCPHESNEEYLTWDELWSGVKSDIDKIRSYLLEHKMDEMD